MNAVSEKTRGVNKKNTLRPGGSLGSRGKSERKKLLVDRWGSYHGCRRKESLKREIPEFLVPMKTGRRMGFGWAEGLGFQGAGPSLHY